MALVLCTGFEHGSPSTQNSPVSGVAIRVWGSGNHDGSYGTTNPHSGTRYLILNLAANQDSTLALKAAISKASIRMYVRFTTLPTADATCFSLTVGGTDLNLNFDIDTGKFAVNFGVGGTAGGPVLVANQWYRVDLKCDPSGNPRTCTWQVDGGTEVAASLAEVAGTISEVMFGATSAYTGVINFDSFIMTDQITDYPIGPGKSVPLVPASDGTHVNPTRFQDDGGTNVNSGTNPAYVELDDSPWTSFSTDYVRQGTADGVGEDSYCEVNFSTYSEGATANGVTAFLIARSSATQANNGACVIRDNSGTESEVYGVPATPRDMSESTAFGVCNPVTVPGAGWTPAEVSALKARFGYSTDVTPFPWWGGIMLEVDVPTRFVPQIQMYVDGG